jgi:hypothetical protein
MPRPTTLPRAPCHLLKIVQLLLFPFCSLVQRSCINGSSSFAVFVFQRATTCKAMNTFHKIWYVGLCGKTILKWILVKQDRVVWTGLIWLRIGTSRGLLWAWKLTFGFYKIWGNSWVAEQLEVSQQGLSSNELKQFSMTSFAWSCPTEFYEMRKWLCTVYSG